MSSTVVPLRGVRELFPNSSDEELQRIKDFMENYALAVWRIYEHLEREKPEILELMHKKENQKNSKIKVYIEDAVRFPCGVCGHSSVAPTIRAPRG